MAKLQDPEWQMNEGEARAEVEDSMKAVNTAPEAEEPTSTEVMPSETASAEMEGAENTEVVTTDLESEDSIACESQEPNRDPVLDAVSELSEKINQMNQLFIQKIQHTTHEEKIVDQMHAELQKYKEDMYAQLVRPILLDIIEIRDSIKRVSANFAAKVAEEQVVPLKTFSDYTYDIEDILEKNNITIYDSKEGDEFSPLKQRAVKKVITPLEELHGKIAESLSSGYDYRGKTISPEKVIVYIYQKPKTTEEENKNG